jgi:hypothetical protein
MAAQMIGVFAVRVAARAADGVIMRYSVIVCGSVMVTVRCLSGGMRCAVVRAAHERRQRRCHALKRQHQKCEKQHVLSESNEHSPQSLYKQARPGNQCGGTANADDSSQHRVSWRRANTCNDVQLTHQCTRIYFPAGDNPAIAGPLRTCPSILSKREP